MYKALIPAVTQSPPEALTLGTGFQHVQGSTQARRVSKWVTSQSAQGTCKKEGAGRGRQGLRHLKQGRQGWPHWEALECV